MLCQVEPLVSESRLPRSLKICYIVSLPLFLVTLCIFSPSLTFSLSVSHTHSLIMCVILSPLSPRCKKVVAVWRFLNFSPVLHCFPFHGCSLSVLKGTFHPSFSFLFPVSPFFLQTMEDSASMKSF